jgi:hypothetical protein
MIGYKPWPIGRRIVGLHQMTDAEASAIGWDEANYSCTEMTAVLVLDDGGWITASADPEQNRGGCLIGEMDGQEVYVWPQEK